MDWVWHNIAQEKLWHEVGNPLDDPSVCRHCAFHQRQVASPYCARCEKLVAEQQKEREQNGTFQPPAQPLHLTQPPPGMYY